MGAGINHFSAEHKMRMGWLAPDRIQEIGGDGIYEIGALELWTQGPKAIALPLDPGAGMAGDRYVFEYRVPEGWDMLTRSGERLKAVVARAGVTFPTTQSADTLIPEDTWRLTPGTVFYDRWRGLTVEVLEMTEGSATVRVRGTGR
jgi:hypothetical protein